MMGILITGFKYMNPFSSISIQNWLGEDWTGGCQVIESFFTKVISCRRVLFLVQSFLKIRNYLGLLGYQRARGLSSSYLEPLACRVTSSLIVSMDVSNSMDILGILGSSGNNQFKSMIIFSPISTILRQFHSHHARQYLNSFFLQTEYSSLSFSKFSRKSMLIHVTLIVDLNFEVSNDSPSVICRIRVSRKEENNSISRNQHQVEHRSNKNLQNTSWLMVTPSSFNASWFWNSFKNSLYSPFPYNNSIWLFSISFKISYQIFQCVTLMQLTVETIPSKLRHSATSFTQSLRPETMAFSISKVGRRDFWSFRLNQRNQKRPRVKLLLLLKNQEMKVRICWKRGWQQMASLRSMSVLYLFYMITIMLGNNEWGYGINMGGEEGKGKGGMDRLWLFVCIISE